MGAAGPVKQFHQESISTLAFRLLTVGWVLSIVNKILDGFKARFATSKDRNRNVSNIAQRFRPQTAKAR
jgi:hypothetical protein